jgi:hypothetical protein
MKQGVNGEGTKFSQVHFFFYKEEEGLVTFSLKETQGRISFKEEGRVTEGVNLMKVIFTGEVTWQNPFEQ